MKKHNTRNYDRIKMKGLEAAGRIYEVTSGEMIDWTVKLLAPLDST